MISRPDYSGSYASGLRRSWGERSLTFSNPNMWPYGFAASVLLLAGCATTGAGSQGLVPGADGAAVMECVIGQDGRLDDCRIISETPEGQGFGEATLGLAYRFQMRTVNRRGQSTIGSRVRIPIQWRLDENGVPASDPALDPTPPEA